jgi:hypothetical protein
MARQVNQPVGQLRQYRKHDWQAWFAGGVWEVKRHELDSRLESLRVKLYTRASEVGLGVRTSLIANVLRFEFYDPIEEASRPLVRPAPEPPHWLSSFCAKFAPVDSSVLSYVDGL